jgi:hypothetical protein
MTNNNPNIITEVHKPHPRLDKIFHIPAKTNEFTRQYEPFNEMFVANAQTAYDKYQKAVELLNDNHGADLIPRLCMALVPIFSTDEDAEKPKLSDQKLGGVPDLREWLYVKKDYTKLKRVWPRCGACHERMRFVGQFDLFPWLIPLFGVFGKTPNGDRMTSPFGGWGTQPPRVTEHHSIFKGVLLQTFMCPFAGEHFDNPNYDSQVFVTSQHSDRILELRENENPPTEDAKTAAEVADELAYLAARPRLKTKNSFTQYTKKIVGWDFRLEIDASMWNHEKCTLKTENYPEIFVQRGSVLFGEPYSQQTPKRPFSQFGYYPEGQRMTPFFNFNDDDADFSYQIYVDFGAGGFGYQYYGKTDGSCT